MIGRSPQRPPGVMSSTSPMAILARTLLPGHLVIHALRRGIVFRQLPLHATATFLGCTGHVAHPFRSIVV